MNVYIFVSTKGDYFYGRGFGVDCILGVLKSDGYDIQAWDLADPLTKENERKLDEANLNRQCYIKIK